MNASRVGIGTTNFCYSFIKLGRLSILRVSYNLYDSISASVTGLLEIFGLKCDSKIPYANRTVPTVQHYKDAWSLI